MLDVLYVSEKGAVNFKIAQTTVERFRVDMIIDSYPGLQPMLEREEICRFET